MGNLGNPRSILNHFTKCGAITVYNLTDTTSMYLQRKWATMNP